MVIFCGGYCGMVNLYDGVSYLDKNLNSSVKLHNVPKTRLRAYLRGKILEDQDFQCLRCGRNLTKMPLSRVHLHHIDRTGGSAHENNNWSNLVVLCDLCHNAVHMRHKVGRTYVSQANPLENKLFEFELQLLKIIDASLMEKEGDDAFTVSFPISPDGQTTYKITLKGELWK